MKKTPGQRQTPPVFDPDALIRLKETSGLDWSQIADRAGVSRSYLTELISPRRRDRPIDPAVSIVVAVSRALDVSPLALLGYTDDDAWQAGYIEGLYAAQRAIGELRNSG